MEPSRGDPEPEALEFEQLLARCMGNLNFAERVLASFQQEFDEDLAGIERGLASGDAEEVARVAHMLKGASGDVAAATLRAEAADIEELAREKRLEKIPPHLERLRSQWSRFVDSVAVLGSSRAPLP
jgi:two-component system sensor histidine kinase/response regulator